ncbi:sensor histidine kinase [Nostoc sp.]|uniref:sensor histidine kinase n=1 Tax=Nostoc sp. TaxID=1180 RepID=UPI003FA53F4E
MQTVGQIAAMGNASVSTTAICNALYRIVQEALTNISKYARATAVTVEIETTSEILQLRVVDNGCGFDRVAPLGQDLDCKECRSESLH